MATVEQNPRLEDWQEADLSVLEEDVVIAGFETVDELEIFTKFLGAQMLSILNTGTTEATKEYLSSTRFRGKTFSERLYRDVQQPMGGRIAFDESRLVCNRINQRSFNPYAPASERLDKPWVTRIHMVTATRLVKPTTLKTISFAGESLTLSLSLYGNHESGVVRIFSPGARLAKKAQNLYPRTTTF
jgi:hypothetical protein